ncbi:integrase [Maritimibacter alkaliphilus]|uniref:integrase n=1 Tax=Maritimibacter alkaliphilus TaxID=404236 RepID=UPI001C959366|nr:integrase [Maritimibacter alkaliphilus]MBY6092315.1 integrase [Maritimibacter alkaliphilus]
MPQPSESTAKAYRADWAHFTRWCRHHGHAPLPPSPEVVSLYLLDLAAPPALASGTIERRLSGLVWNCAQRGLPLDRQDSRITAALATLRRDAPAPARKAMLRLEEVHAMVATLPNDLRGLRDRALLLLGAAGGLRRSEIVGLDLRPEGTPQGTGLLRLAPDGIQLHLRARTGTRPLDIPRLPAGPTCPVQAVESWLHFAQIRHGPVFVATSRDGTRALERRLNDRHIARLIKRTALDAGLRPDLPERDRLALFSGQSLRIGR